MALSKENLLYDLASSAKDYFRDRPYFGCAYGSYPSETAQANSDLDVFFATPDVTPDDISSLTEFIVKYHIDHALMQDEEVPYNNKLVVSYDDISQAVNLKGLSKENGKIIVPPIIKEASFLASLPVRYRLLFNALTSPHEFFGKDFGAYESFRAIAENQLVRVALDLLGLYDVVSVESLIESLFKNRQGEEGEMFLGYKRNPKSIAHITRIIQDRFDQIRLPSAV
jgi:hypothetical protein